MRKMGLLVWMAFLILAVSISCKKKDDNSTPVPTPPTPVKAVYPDPFDNKPLQILSTDEKQNPRRFYGNLYRLMGKSMQEGDDPLIPEQFKKLGETLWEAYDYQHTEMRFDQVMNGLNEITNQITVLQNEIQDLSNQLNLDVTKLENFYTTGDLVQQFNNTNIIWGDTSTPMTFQYFTNEANLYQKGQIPLSKYKLDTADMRTFCYGYSQGVNVGKLDLNIQSMYSDIMPTTTTGQTGLNGMYLYLNQLLSEFTQEKKTDTASIMSAYKLFENYFLQVINYQFRNVTIFCNTWNFYDTTGITAMQYYGGDFQKYITSEITRYLELVNFFVVNAEYRTGNQFCADMPYAQSALAPDLQTMHVMTRAQFIANLLYDALGLPYPVVSGYILYPSQSMSANQLAFTFTPSGSSPIGTPQVMNRSSSSVTIPSQIPYTNWQVGDPAVSSPDNNWLMFNAFWPMNQADNGWFAVPYTVLLQDNGSHTSPWIHFTPVTGGMHPWFYNPDNPSQVSQVYTTNTPILFGYFGACWRWGRLFLTNDEAWNHSLSLPFNYIFFNSSVGNCPWHTGSLQAYTKSDKDVYLASGGNFSYPYSTQGYMTFTGTTQSTDYYYMVGDAWYHNAKTGSSLPPNQGGVSIYGWVNGYYGMKGSGGDDLWALIGTDVISDKCGAAPDNNEAMVNNNVNYNHWHDVSGSWNSGFGNIVSLNANTSYQPGVEYYYQTFNISNVSASISVYANMQFVYSGFYNIPNY